MWTLPIFLSDQIVVPVGEIMIRDETGQLLLYFGPVGEAGEIGRVDREDHGRRSRGH